MLHKLLPQELVTKPLTRKSWPVFTFKYVLFDLIFYVPSAIFQL